MGALAGPAGTAKGQTQLRQFAAPLDTLPLVSITARGDFVPKKRDLGRESGPPVTGPDVGLYLLEQPVLSSTEVTGVRIP
jgi:hypothetical protein